MQYESHQLASFQVYLYFLKAAGKNEKKKYINI